MAVNSQTNNDPHALEAQIRECYGRVVWSHKTHEKCADILTKSNQRLKITIIILSSITSTGLIATLLGSGPYALVISSITSAITLVFSSYSDSFDLGEVAQKHSYTANDLWNIREKYLSLLTDIHSGAISTKNTLALRDQLQTELKLIYRGSPRTISKAYKDASNGLQSMEEMTFTDEEIDKLLPTKLRKGKIAKK